jgi:hypothetical protein
VFVDPLHKLSCLYIDIVIVPNCVNFYAMCCALTILGKCLSTVQLL